MPARRSRSPGGASKLLACLSVASAAVLCTSRLSAACTTQGGFAIFQCGDRAWFDAPPEGSGTVRAVFWQIGFGNAAVNNAEGTNGTGIGPPGVFSGNDSGLFDVPLIAAAPLVDPEGKIGVPEDALCLGPVNWANRGVDGCCDDRKIHGVRTGQDGLLNPNFDSEAMRRQDQFVPDLTAVIDHPMAILLREETGRWFAVAAVASMERASDGPDIRAGHFTLASVADGAANPLTGSRNVIPWQEAPGLRLEEEPRADAPAGAGQEGRRFEASWSPVRVPSDLSRRPSDAEEVGGPGGGVGVLDMGPLVRYGLERARLLPETLGADGIPLREVLLWERLLTTEEPSASLVLSGDSCARVVVILGRIPKSPRVGPLICATGKCGDVGYEVAGPPVCLEGPLLARAGRSGR
ncbi:MAG: hypothetical protein L0323_23125 [Planctomycetes bacterium]|nr:hypothetical protein [Planctomycetota bacterium]